MNLARLLHLLGVVVWIGGMFFAHMVLRPSLPSLQPPQRLLLMAPVFHRFLVWAGVAVIAIAASGVYLIASRGGMRQFGHPVHWMTAIGLLMMAIYVFIVMFPYRRFRIAVGGGDPASAAPALAQLRLLVAVNLGLGLLTIAIAALGA